MIISDGPALLSGISALLLAGHPISAQQRSGHALIRAIDSVAQAALGAGPIAGMSVALVRGSDVLLAKGYGYADLENDVPATEHTVYRIASITKQFTAVAILQLAEQGQLNVDDDIRRHRRAPRVGVGGASGLRAPSPVNLSWQTTQPPFAADKLSLDRGRHAATSLFDLLPRPSSPGVMGLI